MIQVWDVATGEVVVDTITGHLSPNDLYTILIVNPIAFLPDG
jgi:hypothetical protein